MNTQYAAMTENGPLAQGQALPDALDAPRLDFATEYGSRIAYYVDGPTDGRPLVLVHSINAAPSAFEMKPLFERYRAGRRVYAPDLPGFGASDRSKRRYSPELYAGALGAFLEHVVVEPADVVTLSLSAEFVVRAALRGTRLHSLVCISPTGFSRRPVPGKGVSNVAHSILATPGLSKGLFDLLTRRPIIRHFLNQSFIGQVPDEMIEYAYATARQPGAWHAPLRFLAGQLFTADAPDALYGKFEAPALVLYDEDPNTGFGELPAFVDRMPNWRSERIAPTRGVPHWERLEDTSAAMERFWGGI